MQSMKNITYLYKSDGVQWIMYFKSYMHVDYLKIILQINKHNLQITNKNKNIYKNAILICNYALLKLILRSIIV